MLSPQRDLWFGTSGPRDAKVVLVAESWGSEEEKEQCPLVGSSGIELDRMLAEAGLKRHDILTSNIVAARPFNNEMHRFFHPKDGRDSGGRIGGLLPNELVRSEVSRLYAQISAHPRAVVIAAGNYALWGLARGCTGTEVLRSASNRPIAAADQTYAPNGIMSWRGSMWHCDPHPELCAASPFFAESNMSGLRHTRLLPLIHPAAILRAWENRAVTVHDLKARVPMALRGDWRRSPAPVVWAPPSYRECLTRLDMWITRASLHTPVRLAVDIETSRGFITCLGLADSVSFAMSIPFIRKTEEGGFDSYWTTEQESEILHRLRRLFLSPHIFVEGQNFIYDTQYIQHWMGTTPRLDFDTMLAQNVAFPGTPKDLGYLSSLYCSYHWYWKEDHKEWNLSGTVEQLLRYNAEDVLRTWEIAESQRALLKSLGLEPQMHFKMRTNDLCLRMMNRGMLIDTKKRGAMLSELSDALNGIYAELETILPQDLVQPGAKVRWYRSDKQTKHVLYDMFAMRGVKNRKTGRPTSGKEALSQLKKWYPEFSGLLNRLDVAGSVDNSCEVIRTPLDPDGRMRCSFNPGGTETHRLSSSKNAFGRGTNLQNLTTGEED